MAKLKKKAEDGSMYGVIGQVGTQNYLVKDTPCLMPKENMKFFNTMRKNSDKSSFGDFPNPFNVFWKGSGK